jgi:hypothetical protein
VIDEVGYTGHGVFWTRSWAGHDRHVQAGEDGT